MAAMVVTPLRWFRNKRTELVCQSLSVSGGWVRVRYHGTGIEREYRIEQFVGSFEPTLKPTR